MVPVLHMSKYTLPINDSNIYILNVKYDIISIDYDYVPYMIIYNPIYIFIYTRGHAIIIELSTPVDVFRCPSWTDGPAHPRAPETAAEDPIARPWSWALGRERPAEGFIDSLMTFKNFIIGLSI